MSGYELRWNVDVGAYSSIEEVQIRGSEGMTREAGSYQRGKGSNLFSEEEWKKITLVLQLSNREAEIVRGVFDDQKEIAIADDIGISVHTVRTYSQRLYRKLNALSRIGVITRIVGAFLAIQDGGRTGHEPDPGGWRQ